METWRLLGHQWERLRWARLNRTSFERVKDAAESLGIKPGTYRTYEHAPGTEGGRLPTLNELQRICRKYKVSWVWVATGQGSPDADQDERVEQLGKELGEVPPEDQAAALRAALGAVRAFKRAG